MRLETVQIPGEETTLAGLRYLPEGEPRDAALLFAHGFTSGKFSMDHLAGYLAARGYEGLTFDFVGHKLGGTGGAMQTMRQGLANVTQAARWLHERVAPRRLILIGHSMGGGLALAAAGEAQQRGAVWSPAGVVAMCIGSEPTHGFNNVIGKTMLAQRQDYVNGAPPLTLLEELGEIVRAIPPLVIPSLFIAGTQDVLVSQTHIERLAHLVGANASLLPLETTHLEAPDRAKIVVLKWLEKLAV